MTLRRALLLMFVLSICATASANEKFYGAVERGDLIGALHILRTEAVPSLDSPRLVNLLATLSNDAANAIVSTIRERMRVSQDENESSTQLDGRDHSVSGHVTQKQVQAVAAQMPDQLRRVFLFGVEFGQSVNKNSW